MTGAPAPSASGLRRILSDVAGFATSQYALRFASLVKGFVIARVLGPAGNGLWQHFALIFEYSQYSHLGVLPGYNKRLGHQIGAGDEAGVRATRDTGLTGVVGSAVVLWIGLCLWAWSKGDALHPIDRWGLPILGLVVVLEQVTLTYFSLLRAYSRIGIVSVVSVAFALSNLVLALALLPGLEILGLLVAWLVTRAATTLWLVRRSGHPPRFGFDPRVLGSLLATGFPIYLYQLTRAALRNVDRVLVDTVLDDAELGIYGLAVTLASLVRYGADAISFVIYPIFLRLYGETRDPTRLREHLEKPTMFLALFVPIVLGFSWLVLHLPVLWLLPAFERSIEIFRLLTVSIVFSCLGILPGFYMMAIDRQNWLVPLGIGAIAFNAFVGFELIERGHGLAGVAAAMGAGLLVHTTVVLLVSGRHAFGSLGAAGRWVARTYAPVLWCAAVVAGLRYGIPHTPLGAWEETPRALVEGAVFLLVSVPLLADFERRTGFLRRIRRRTPPGAPPPASP